MTIPDKPLELDLKTKELTLAEAAIFDKDETASNPMGWINLVRKFLLARSVSWTPDEINAIAVNDLASVGKQIAEAFQRVAVPLVTSPRSKTGRAAKERPALPSGRSTSNTAGSSTSRPKKSASE